jgi:anaerobic selenocysteine-containing dehydrogenase
MGETISNFDLFQTLGRKLGFTDAAFEQSLDQRLRSYARTIPELDSDFELDLHLDGGYVESPRTHDLDSPFDRERPFRFINADDPTLPRYPHLCDGAEFDHPDLSARFPFKLITPPDDKLLNSTFGEMYPAESGRVLIHPEDGARRGISDGDSVYLYNFRGRLKRRALVCEDTQPGLLVAEGLYWPVADEDGGVNDLTSQQCSDIGGGAIFHESRVQIEPAY